MDRTINEKSCIILQVLHKCMNIYESRRFNSKESDVYYESVQICYKKNESQRCCMYDMLRKHEKLLYSYWVFNMSNYICLFGLPPTKSVAPLLPESVNFIILSYLVDERQYTMKQIKKIINNAHYYI